MLWKNFINFHGAVACSLNSKNLKGKIFYWNFYEKIMKGILMELSPFIHNSQPDDNFPFIRLLLKSFPSHFQCIQWHFLKKKVASSMCYEIDMNSIRMCNVVYSYVKRIWNIPKSANNCMNNEAANMCEVLLSGKFHELNIFL